MKSFEFKEPQTVEEFKAYFLFRWEILRKPYKKVIGTEKDEYEKKSFHIMALDLNKIIGVGRIHQISNSDNRIYAQVRYMAVSKEYRNNSIGTEILKKLEQYAYNRNINKIILHSRESAVDFYVKNGYKVKNKSYVLYDSIQHWMMEKIINF